MKKSTLSTLSILSIAAAALLLTGCNSETSWGFANGSEVLKIEPTGGNTSAGTPLPNITMGGSASAVAKTNFQDTKPMFFWASTKTLLGQLFGIGATNCACAYIGAPNEDAAATQARMASFAQVMAAAQSGEVTDATTTDTATGADIAPASGSDSSALESAAAALESAVSSQLAK